MKSLFLAIKIWVNKTARSPLVIVGLFFVSFFDSIFSPLPPDPLLLISVAVNKKKWLRLTASVFVGSILGAIVAYVLGRAFYDTFGVWMIDTYSLQEEFAKVQISFQENTFLAVLVGAVTPIPYKLFTLTAGFTNASIFQFILASVIGRGARYFLLGYITSIFGDAFYKKMNKKVERTFWALFAVVFIASIVYAIWHFVK